MFYPLIKLSGFEGWTTISNFPPNDWENKERSAKLIHLIWSAGDVWKTEFFDRLDYGKSLSIATEKIGNEKLENGICFVFPSSAYLPATLTRLPRSKHWLTGYPSWRATVGIRTPVAQVSYQGEMNPFPEKASLLTFHPFIQFDNFTNYLLLINLQQLPALRKSELEIYDSAGKSHVDSVSVQCNSANLIPLNPYGFGSENLPVFVCRQTGGIPFGFGHSESGRMLSLEHTHPPAEFVIHGNKLAMQKRIKKGWFEALRKPSST